MQWRGTGNRPPLCPSGKEDMRTYEIVYKSGTVRQFNAEYFHRTRHGYEWKNASPAPVELNMNEIESVWDLGEVKPKAPRIPLTTTGSKRP
jgi:hypothetical protein